MSNINTSGVSGAATSSTGAEELPIKTGNDFIGEFETMDLSKLKDKTFLVSVSTGDRNKSKFLCSCVRGPFDFSEMCEEVGTMWKVEQHHAKVVILSKDRSKSLRFLDENTTDYIEARFIDIITNEMLSGTFDEPFTCQANVVEDEVENDPILKQRLDSSNTAAAADDSNPKV